MSKENKANAGEQPLERLEGLLKLAHQYASDVKGRIETLEAESDDGPWVDRDDIEEQIAHWEATLDQIKKTLGE